MATKKRSVEELAGLMTGALAVLLKFEVETNKCTGVNEQEMKFFYAGVGAILLEVADYNVDEVSKASEKSIAEIQTLFLKKK